jgi:hypothetical protein
MGKFCPQACDKLSIPSEFSGLSAWFQDDGKTFSTPDAD